MLSENSVIKVQNLEKIFPGNVRAVDSVSFDVREGEIFGFIGPNGAGKTTTLKIMSGILAPTEGSVMIDGIDMARQPEKAKPQSSR